MIKINKDKIKNKLIFIFEKLKKIVKFLFDKLIIILKIVFKYVFKLVKFIFEKIKIFIIKIYPIVKKLIIFILDMTNKVTEKIYILIEQWTPIVKKYIHSIKKKLNINTNDENIDDVENVDGSVSSDSFVKTNLSEEDKKAAALAIEQIELKKKKKKALINRIISIIFIVIFLIIIIRFFIGVNKKNAEKAELMKKVQKVQVMNISQELSGSGTLKPKDSYTITSLVEGEVTEVNFDEGDKVEKDQLLLVIDSKTAYRNITNASSSLAQAKESYDQSLYEYEKLLDKYSDNTYKAEFSGHFRELKIKKSDVIGNNTEIGTIIDDSIMILKVPFTSMDAIKIRQGMRATVFIQEMYDAVDGIVQSVAKEERVLNGGLLVSYVTIECQNPGGITTDNTAMASIMGMTSVGDANFLLKTEEKIVFSDGNNVEIEELLVQEGAYVEKGDPIFKITDKSINNVLSAKKNSYLQANDSLIRAQTNYDDSLDNYDEYYIKAPISGTVINKNVKVGDKVQRNSSSTTTLAVIYDLSELTIDMDVDELDISKVEVGQRVRVTADAFGNQRFNGEITKINLVANNSNGVTNYPVTVAITDIGNLLPGMNVDANVVLSSAENAVCIPADALQRGNVVYVLNSSKTIKSKQYKTDEIGERIKKNTPSGFTAVQVTTGVSNDNYIQILEGLQEGDLVYVNTTQTNTNRGNMFTGQMGGGMPGGMPGGMQGGRR